MNIVSVMRLCKIMRAGQATDENMAHARCMLDTKGNKYPQYLIRIAFPLQQWLPERASWLRYTYIAVISLTSVVLSAPIIRLLNNGFFFVRIASRPNPQLDDESISSLFGSSPLTCPAWEVLLVAKITLAWLSASWPQTLPVR